jgi:hypothetical protein
MSKWEKKTENHSTVFLVSGCYSIINKNRKTQRKVEQESVERMLQWVAERKTGVSQLLQYVGQIDDFEIYGGPHPILSDEGM